MKRLVCAALLLAWTVPATAEVRPSDINRPAGESGLGPGYGGNRTQWSVEMTGGLGTRADDRLGDVERLTLSPMLRLATPERRNDFEIAWGMLSYRRSLTDLDHTRQDLLIGNVYLHYSWAWRTLAQQFRLGLGFALPTANLPTRAAEDTELAVDGYAEGMRTRGWREIWMWTPETLTANAHVDYYLRTASGFIIGGEVIVGWMQRISDSDDVIEENNLLVTADLDLIYELSAVRFSVRSGVVALPLTDTEDTVLPFGDADPLFHVSVEPEARIRLGPVDLIARLIMPITQPAGFAFSSEGSWAATLGLGNPTSVLLPED